MGGRSDRRRRVEVWPRMVICLRETFTQSWGTGRTSTSEKGTTGAQGSLDGGLVQDGDLSQGDVHSILAGWTSERGTEASRGVDTQATGHL